jgi:4-hydroxybenzoate polyprenyltransferase
LHNVLGLYIHENKIYRDKLTIISKMKFPLFFLIILSAIGSTFCFFHLTIKEIASLTVFAFISIWYVIPIFENKKRLSDYPIIKIFMVALVWAALAVIIPLGEINIDLKIKSLLFLEKFMFIFALVIPFDIRDIEFDSSRNIKTIPIILGKRKSIIIALIAIFISIAIAIYLFTIDIYASNLISPIILGYLISAIVIAFTHNKTKDYYFTGLVDALPIINYLILLTFI